MEDRMKKIKLLGAVALSAAVVCGFASCKKEKAAANEFPPVKIGYRTGNLCAAPMHIAILDGYFEREFEAIGQKFETVHQIVTNGTTATLVGAGTIDAGFELISSMLQSMENGLPIVFASGIHTGCTKYYVRADSDIETVADLRGKKIGVPGLGDSSVMNLKRKLADEGIDVSFGSSEVEFIAYEPAALGINLQNGEIDAFGMHDPLAHKFEQEYGFRKIFDIGEDEKFSKEYCCQIFVTEDLLEKNPEGAKAFIRAAQKASAFVAANPRKAAEIQLANDYVTGDIELNTQLLSAYNYTPSYEYGRLTFLNAATELKNIGVLKEATDVEDFIRRGYVRIEGIPEGYKYDAEKDEFIEL